MGRGEEDFVQLAALPVQPRIQQHQEHPGKTQIDEPSPFPSFHAADEDERNQADQQQQRGELLARAVDVETDLAHELGGLGEDVRRLDRFILATLHRVDEALRSPRIAPVQGRIAHRRDRHVEIPHRPQTPRDEGDDRVAEAL
jgi:hypothetical protein